MHHYHFRLLAVAVDRLAVPAGCSCEEAHRAASAQALAEAELLGTYAR